MANTTAKHSDFITPPDVLRARQEADDAFNDKVEVLPIFYREERTIPGPGGPLPIRIYRPGDRTDYPVLLYFHGGGFVIHNLASHDSLCRKLATEFDCLVLSVGYRLAPEFPYPAAIEDGFAALNWASEHARSLGGDPRKLLLSGDSAGATLSAALSLVTRDRRGPKITAQLLFYGSFGCLSPDESPSMQEYGNGDYILSRAMTDWFDTQYLRGCDASAEQEAYCHPGRAADLSRLPTTLVVTAELDPLRDDGETFARRLKAAGNTVSLFRMPELLHGFLLCWDQYESIRTAITSCKKWLFEIL